MAREFDKLYRPHHYYELVVSDFYNISGRIKKIDEGYFIMFNRLSKKFEVHHKENIGRSYCFTVPYDKLDIRTLQLTRETSIAQHGNEVYKKLERDNEKLQKCIDRELADQREEVVDTFKWGCKKIYEEV